MKLLHASLLITAAPLLSGCSDTPGPDASGEQLFSVNCAGCHGEEGQGKFLRGIPPNYGTYLSRYDVIRLIRSGDKRFPDMPVFPHLSTTEAGKIADHLRLLQSRG